MKHESTDYALITGATGGIGAEFARLLCHEGKKVILVGRTLDKLEKMAAELGARATYIQADLSLPGASGEIHEACVKRGLKVDCLINNAGAGLFGASIDLDPTAVDRMLALNMAGLTGLCSLFGKDMAGAGRGSILNVGSIAGRVAMPYFASYAASKAYVHAYSLALRAELAASGVQVCCLLPGYVRTAFDDNAGIASVSYRKFSAGNSMDAASVARIGIRALGRGRAMRIAGATNRVAALGMALLPKAFLPRVMKRFLDHLIAKG